MATKTFVFEYNKNREERHKQIQQALREYTGVDGAEILYTNRGKPYIKGLPTEKYVSVTTAGEVTVCVFSDSQIGIDGEKLTRFDDFDKKAEYVALAERFFADDEVEHIRSGDTMCFANIWVRKEAYVKYTGKGMAEFPNFSVSDGERYLNRIGGVTLKKFSPSFPGANEYLFIVAGEYTE